MFLGVEMRKYRADCVSRMCAYITLARLEVRGQRPGETLAQMLFPSGLRHSRFSLVS